MLSATSPSDTMVTGGLYELSFDAGTESSMGNISVMANLATLGVVSTAGSYEYTFRALSTSGLTFVCSVGGGESVTLDNIKLQRIPHNALTPHNMEDEDFQSTSLPASTTKGRLV